MTTTTEAAWVHTEEAYVQQRGEGRRAEYRVKIGDRVEPAGESDEAFLQACKIRDELVRELTVGGEVLAELANVAPPNPGDPTMCPVQLLELADGGKARIRVAGIETEIDYDVLRRA